MYIKKATVAIIAVVAIGFIVLITGYLERREFVLDFLSNAWADAAVLLSAILLYPLFRAIRFGRVKRCRFFAGLQVALVLFAAAITHFPMVVATKSGRVNFMENIAPESVMNVLGISLIVGGLLILPGFFHLLKSFGMIKMLGEK